MGVTVAIAGWFCAAAALPVAHAAIVVAYESGVDAYVEALAGMEAGLDAHSARAIDVHAAGGLGALERALASPDARLVITVGSRALAEVQSRHPAAPVLATMVLHGGGEAPAGRLEVEVGLAAQLEAIHTLLPRAQRVGIIRDPARSRYTTEMLESRARKLGFTAVVVECGGAAQLLKAVTSLKGKVDVLLCFPDPELYNAVTIKPLILASIDLRLPVVGFSPAFVRAGAAVGIYADYREVGRQTAAMAGRYLRGEERLGKEEPFKVRVSINQRVARLLGVEFRTRGLAVEVLK